MRPALASALIYAAVTAVMGRVVLGSLGTSIANDPGDPLLNATILGWNARHVPWTDAWFQFPIFHPTANALTLSEHLLGVSVLASPIHWLTGNALVAYNLSLLLAFPLSGLAMYALVLRLTQRPAAAFLAGLAFAFAPYRISHLPQIQVQFVFWAPLALLGLHAFLEAGGRGEGEGWRGGERGGRAARWRWLALYAVCWMLQGAANGYMLVYFSVLIGLWGLWFLVAKQRWRDAAAVVAATAVASLPLVPILYRYAMTHREMGLSRNIGEIAFFGADIAGLGCAPPALTFWGWLQVACGPEGELFAGVTILVLAVLAIRVRNGQPIETPPELFRGGRLVRRVAVGLGCAFLAIAAITAIAGPWRAAIGPLRASASAFDKPLSSALMLLLVAYVLSPAFRGTVRRGSMLTFYLAAALVCWVFAWGPFPRLLGVETLYQAPFAWLMQMPGVESLRVPARFWMLTVLCLSVIAGLVTARLLPAGGRRAAPFVVAIAIGLLIDGWTTIPINAAPLAVPGAEALRGRDVLVLPVDLDRDAAAGFRAVAGGWRSINGYSGYAPGYYEALSALARAEDDALFGPFVERGDVDVLIDTLAPGVRAFVERQPGARFIGRAGDIRHYRLPRRSAAPPAAAPGAALAIRAVTAPCDAQGAPFLTDGRLDTEWVCGALSPDQQITIDLRTAAAAGALALAFGPHATGFPRELVVEASLDGVAWDVVWTGSPAAAVLRAAIEAPRETRIVLTFEPRELRYLRLRQTDVDDRFWSVAEIELRSGAP